MNWRSLRDREPFTYGRHLSDVARFLIGMAVVIGSALLVDPNHVGALERDVFHLINDLPDVLFPFMWVVMQLGNLLAVPLMAGVALATRHVRMALDIMVVGVAAYLGAGIFKQIFERARPHQLLASVIVRGDSATGLGFVSGHAAVAAALATAAHPYLSPRGRRIVWILAFLVMVSRRLRRRGPPAGCDRRRGAGLRDRGAHASPARRAGGTSDALSGASHATSYFD